MKAPGGTFLDHPKGVFLLAATEFWERYGYLGMLSLLALFLTAPTATGGFGWRNSQAIAFFGFYSGLAYLAPAAGSWLANNYLGERKAILLGSIIFALGYLTLSASTLVPHWVSERASTDIMGILSRAKVTVGSIYLSAADRMAIADVALTGRQAEATMLAHALTAWSFYGGLLLSIIGTALLKAPIASLVGKLYHRDDRNVDAGYSIFYASIVVGAFAAPLVAGGLGERFGWYLGFLSAAFGMAIAIAIYCLLAPRYLGEIGLLPDASENTVPKAQISADERSRSWLILISIILVSIYSGAFYQKGGLLNIYTRDNVDRMVDGFEIPASWFLSITYAIGILATPIFIYVFRMLQRRGRCVGPLQKLGVAFFAMSIGYCCLSYAFYGVDNISAPKVSLWWIVFLYVIFGFCDILVFPPQLAMISKLAPPSYRTVAMGAFYLAPGLGNWLAGFIGSMIAYLPASALFLLIAFCLSFSGFGMIIFHGRLVKMSRGMLYNTKTCGI